MKKLLIAITVTTLIYSCQKDKPINEPQLNEGAKARVTNEQVNDSTGSFNMQFTIFNCITHENVNINGAVSYTYKATDSKVYYSQVISMSGIGETSGLTYTGTSREIGTTTLELNYLNEPTTTGGTNYKNFTITSSNGVRYQFTYYDKYTIDSEGFFHIIVEKIVNPC